MNFSNMGYTLKRDMGYLRGMLFMGILLYKESKMG
jgi:hypothetical protein